MEIISKALPAFFLISELLLLIFKRAKSSATRIKQDKLSIQILWTVVTISVLAGLYLANLYPMPESIPALLWIGLFLLIVGMVIRWKAIYQLGKAFTVNVAVSSTQKIKENGLYKKIRHPSYSGLLLEFLGLSLLFNSWYPLLVINIPIICALVYRIKVEEGLLSHFFGSDYEEYKKRTKRIIPYIW